jgi:hypothetical protein
MPTPTQAQINTGIFKIQCLDVLVDPTLEALPVDEGTNDIDLITDPSTNNNAAGYGDRNPLYKGVRRRVRDGGSGVQPNRNQHFPFRAVDDLATAEVGGASVNIDPLLNDTFTGQPQIAIVSGPILAGATAVVTGAGNESLVFYTPPATGDGGTDRIRYRLRANRSRGSQFATIRVNVTSGDTEITDYGPFDTPPIFIMTLQYAPGSLPGAIGGLFKFNLADSFTLVAFVDSSDPGPFPGYPPTIVACDSAQFDAMWQAFADTGNFMGPGGPIINPTGDNSYLEDGGVLSITTSPGTGPAGPTVRDLDDFEVTPA